MSNPETGHIWNAYGVALGETILACRLCGVNHDTPEAKAPCPKALVAREDLAPILDAIKSIRAEILELRHLDRVRRKT